MAMEEREKTGVWSLQFLVDLSADYLFRRCRHVPELLSITKIGVLSSLYRASPTQSLNIWPPVAPR
jgi:hypothetical protein